MNGSACNTEFNSARGATHPCGGATGGHCNPHSMPFRPHVKNHRHCTTRAGETVKRWFPTKIWSRNWQPIHAHHSTPAVDGCPPNVLRQPKSPCPEAPHVPQMRWAAKSGQGMPSYVNGFGKDCCPCHRRMHAPPPPPPPHNDHPNPFWYIDLGKPFGVHFMRPDRLFSSSAVTPSPFFRMHHQ